MSKQIIVNNRLFQTKSEFYACCKSELERCRNTKTHEVLPEMQELLIESLPYHPNYEEKWAGGKNSITCIIAKKNDVRSKNWCFYTITEKEGEQDFSYLKLFSNKERVIRINILSALRNAIKEQCDNYRKAYLTQNNFEKECFICEVTGKKFPLSELAVDHKIPFKDLVSQWLNKNNLSLETLEIKEWLIDKKYIRTLCNKELEKSWQKFHSENAVLQCVHRTLNLKMNKRIGESREQKVQEFLLTL